MLCFSKSTYWTELNSYVCLVQLYTYLLGTLLHSPLLYDSIWSVLPVILLSKRNVSLYIILIMMVLLFILYVVLKSQTNLMYWATQKLPQICTEILRICIGKVAWFAVYICDNFWVTQYVPHMNTYFSFSVVTVSFFIFPKQCLSL